MWHRTFYCKGTGSVALSGTCVTKTLGDPSNMLPVGLFGIWSLFQAIHWKFKLPVLSGRLTLLCVLFVRMNQKGYPSNNVSKIGTYSLLIKIFLLLCWTLKRMYGQQLVLTRIQDSHITKFKCRY